MALKRTDLACLSGSEKSQLCGYITVGVQSDVPLPLNMHTAMFATGQWLVDDALRNTLPSVDELLLQLVNVMLSGRAET